MAFLNGLYFTKSGERNLTDFLLSLELSDSQTTAIKIHAQTQVSAQILLWCSLIGPIALVAGVLIGASISG